MSGSNSTMAIANPVDVESPRVKSGRLVAALESTLQELNGCRGDAGIQRVSAKVDAIMAQMSDVSAFQAATRDGLLKAIHEAELALKRAGQSVKAGRMGKMRKLMSRLPKESPKKQRKMLREILKLSGKNAGVAVGKRSFCDSKLCFGVCVTGSVLALAGASVVIALAATGQLGDEFAVVEDNGLDEAAEVENEPDEAADPARGVEDAHDDLADQKKTLKDELNAYLEDNEDMTDRKKQKLKTKLDRFLEKDKLGRARKLVEKIETRYLAEAARIDEIINNVIEGPVTRRFEITDLSEEDKASLISGLEAVDIVHNDTEGVISFETTKTTEVDAIIELNANPEQIQITDVDDYNYGMFTYWYSDRWNGIAREIWQTDADAAQDLLDAWEKRIQDWQTWKNWQQVNQPGWPRLSDPEFGDNFSTFIWGHYEFFGVNTKGDSWNNMPKMFIRLHRQGLYP